MEFYDDYSEEFEDFFIDDKALQSKIDVANRFLDEGQAVIQAEFIEETIQLCLDNEKLEMGLELTDKFLDIFPFNSEYWQMKGIFLNSKFDFINAYLAFEKTLALNPTDVESLIGKSIAEESLDLFDDAVLSLEKVLEIEENSYIPYHIRCHL